MIHLLRTSSENKHFIELVTCLDKDLAIRDGDEYSFYSQFNKIEHITHVVIAFENEIAVGCGALKKYNATSAELKRMYTAPTARRKGIAAKIIAELETWAMELGYENCILETGKKQPEAIQLYTKCGYIIIENYGQYKGIANSICFEKQLKTI